MLKRIGGNGLMHIPVGRLGEEADKQRQAHLCHRLLVAHRSVIVIHSIRLLEELEYVVTEESKVGNPYLSQIIGQALLTIFVSHLGDELIHYLTHHTGATQPLDQPVIYVADRGNVNIDRSCT